MKTLKKALALLLAALLAFSCMAVGVTAGDAPEAQWSTGDTFFLGSFEQDNNTDNGKEPIEWILLDPETGLSVSKYILNVGRFDNMVNTYSQSEVRGWLFGEQGTGDFYKNSFTGAEKEALKSEEFSVRVSGSLNKYDTMSDKVFLLSAEDATEYLLGREEISGIPTAYAYDQNPYMDYSAAPWWLRDACEGLSRCASVPAIGGVDTQGAQVSDERYGIRPAIKVDLTGSVSNPEITLYANNDKNGSVKISAVNGESIIPECPFTNDDLNFCGWYKDVNCNQPWTGKDKVTVSTSLYAGWAEYRKGDVIELGSYEQDNNEANGKEPIEWILLDPATGLCVSKYGLDVMSFEDNGDNDYKNSDIRSWLYGEEGIGEFYINAFTEEEKALIKADKIITCDDGADRVIKSALDDKVFLLSLQDAENELYFADNEERMCSATRYALAQSAYTAGGGLCHWWLRSPCSSTGYVKVVDPEGKVMAGGKIAEWEEGCVRPALYLDLKAGVLDTIITVAANNGTDESRNIITRKFRSVNPECPFTNGDLNFCGWYKDAACTRPWTDTDKVKGEMTLYAGWTDFKPYDTITFGSYEQDNKTQNGMEPLEWIILDPATGLCVSKYAIHAMAFMESGSDYKKSAVRSWLVGYFGDVAFTEEERALLKTNDIVTFKAGSDSEVASILQDDIFLLSVQEARNYFDLDTMRICCPTAYAWAQGPETDSSGNCWWWLRTTGTDVSNCVAEVVPIGLVDEKGYYADTSLNCVRPAIYLDLKSGGVLTQISGCTIDDIPGCTYNGSAQKPGVTVKDGDKTLVQDRDYTVTYADNTDAGTAKATITGIKSYAGSVTRSFTISPASISTAAVTLSPASVTYNGSEQTPAVTVKLDTVTLEEGKDYTVNFGDNLKAGDATVTVTGKGNYTGKATGGFTIGAKTITEDMIQPIPAVTYTGSKIEPEVTLKDGNVTLNKDADYTVEFENNTGAGTATVTVTGAGNYKGTAIASFTINPLTVQINWADKSFTYNGTEQCPAATVANKVAGDVLILEISGAQTEAGTGYKAEVVGIGGKDMGNYELPAETVSKIYSIAPASQNAPTGLGKTDETKCSANDGTITGVTTAMEFAYERGEYKPCKGTEITGLQPGTYSVRFAADNNHTASDAVQLIIGKGACYGGEATCIAKAECEGCGEPYGEINPGNHHCVQKSDEGYHWMECECGYTEGKAAHKDEDKDLKCDTCGYNLAAVTEIKGFPTEAMVLRDKAVDFSCESSYGKVIYTSSDPSVATVDENGVVTPVGRGECTITAQVEGSNIREECSVTVTTSFLQFILTILSRIKAFFMKILALLGIG